MRKRVAKGSEPATSAVDKEEEDGINVEVPKKGGKAKGSGKSKAAAKKESSEEREEYEVEEIVGDRLTKGKIQYKVRWKGCLEEDDTWHFESELNCDELIQSYHETNDQSDKREKSSNGATEDEDENGEVDNKKSSKGKGRSKKGKLIKNESEREENEEDDGNKKTKAAKKGRGTSKKGKGKKQESENEEEDDEKSKPKSKKRGAAKQEPEEDDDEKPKGKKQKGGKSQRKKSAVKEESEDEEEEEAYEQSEEGENNDSDDEKKNEVPKKKPKVVKVSKAEFEVKEIIDMNIKSNGVREFLVRWKGYESDDDTWEPEQHLNCKKLIETFMNLHGGEGKRERKPVSKFPISSLKGKTRGARGAMRKTYFDQE